MRKQILTQGNLRQEERAPGLTRAEMHAYYIAIVAMNKLVFNPPVLKAHS